MADETNPEVTTEEVNGVTVEEVPTKFYNANDGVFGRTGGPYLDIEQDKAEERRRASLEDRDPDFENLQPSAGTLLVPAELLVQRFNSTHLDAQDQRKFDGTIEAPVRAEAVVPVTVETPVETSPEPNFVTSDGAVDNPNETNVQNTTGLGLDV